MNIMDVEEDAYDLYTGENFSGHKLLLDVDADLDSNDVENIKFLCQGTIGMSKLQKMERGLEVFDELERVTLIEPKNQKFDYLVEILCRIHRFDLVRKLAVDSKQAKRKYRDGDFTQTQLSPLRILLFALAEDMEEKEFQEVIFILGQRFGKAIMKKMKNMLQVFTYLEKEQELEPDDVELLKYILGNLQIKRNDLLDKVKEYEKYPWKRGRKMQDIEMQPIENLQRTQETVGIPVIRGPKHLSGNVLIHISAEVSKKPDWRKLIDELGLTREEFAKVVPKIDTPQSQILKMLTYWKDTKQKDNKECGQILFMSLQSAGFGDIANKLAEEYLPGVEGLQPEYDRELSDLNQPGQRAEIQPMDIPDPQLTRVSHTQFGVTDPVQPPPPQARQNTGSQREERVAPQQRLEESITSGLPDIANIAAADVHRGVTSTQGPPAGSNSSAQEQPNANEVRLMESGIAAPRTQDPPLPGGGQPVNEMINAARTMNLDVEQDLPSYKMNVTPRGYAVIINNNKFFKSGEDPESKELPHRTGTERDAERLKYIFQKLNFIVICCEDMYDYQMCQLMSEYAAKNHKDFDCFVCCVLSHGAAGHVYGVNGRLVRIDILTSFFRSQNCPTLAGKPKLFFIQACQGRDKQKGYDLEQDTALERRDKPDKPEIVEDLQREMIPDEADFLLGYATVPGYVSYRSRSQGSWYVNKLVDMLDKYACRFDLMSIMVKVNEEVGRANANIDGGRYKQIPAPLVTLRKKLYFR